MILMLKIEMIFKLDLQLKSTKEMLEPMGMPIPTFVNAAESTISVTRNGFFSDEEKEVFIEVANKTFVGTEMGRFVVSGSKFAGFGDISEAKERTAFYRPNRKKKQAPKFDAAQGDDEYGWSKEDEK